MNPSEHWAKKSFVRSSYLQDHESDVRNWVWSISGSSPLGLTSFSEHTEGLMIEVPLNLHVVAGRVWWKSKGLPVWMSISWAQKTKDHPDRQAHPMGWKEDKMCRTGKQNRKGSHTHLSHPRQTPLGSVPPLTRLSFQGDPLAHVALVSSCIK